MSTKIKNLAEKKIKAALIEHLLNKNACINDSVLISELALENFSRRADIVLINDDINIFEIKSESDNISRLSGQIETFTRYCDKMHVVTASCHLEKIIISTPNNVAVWEKDNNGHIKIIRQGFEVPLTNKEQILKLVNVKELQQILKENKIKYGNLNREKMVALATDLSIQTLRESVMQKLKTRYAITTSKFLHGIDQNGAITPAHLDALKIEKNQLSTGNITNASTSKIYEDKYLMRLAKESKTPIFGKPPVYIQEMCGICS